MTIGQVQAVQVDVPGVGVLDADFSMVSPGGPAVVFAHGSGSSRQSPRNQAVARRLHQAGFSTLLVDLLTLDRGEDRAAWRPVAI